MARGKKLPEIRSPEDFDATDRKILDAIDFKPNATLQEISDSTGIPVSTIQDRLDRIRSSEWADRMRFQLRGRFGGRICRVYDSALDSHDPQVQLRAVAQLAKHLGLDIDRTENINRNTTVPSTAEEVLDGFARLSSADQSEVLKKLRVDLPGATQSDA